MYAQLNIGRNVNDTPMSAARWAMFKGNAATALLMAAAESAVTRAEHLPRNISDMIECHTGTGTWDGVTEESAHISVFSPVGVDRAVLMARVETLANEYAQDSIAVIVGSELVTHTRNVCKVDGIHASTDELLDCAPCVAILD